MITLITGFKLGLQATLPLLKSKVLKQKQNLRGTQRQFSENICSEDDNISFITK